MKKYYILALTFLCMLVGHSSYGQGYGGDYDLGDIANDFCAQNPESCHFYDSLQDYLDAHPEIEVVSEYEYINAEQLEFWKSGHTAFEISLAHEMAGYIVVPVSGTIELVNHDSDNSANNNDSGNPCDPWSSAYDFYLCNGMGINNDSGNPCDPSSYTYNPSQCTGDSGDPCDPSSYSYNPSQCTGDSGDPCDPYSSAYDYNLCNGSSGGTASTCRGCAPVKVDDDYFPNLLTTIGNIKTYLINHPLILNNFKTLSGYSSEEIMTLLEPNNIRTKIRITNLSSRGEFNHNTPNVFYIDKFLIKNLELGEYNDTFGNHEDLNGISFFIAITILHELVHYGRYHNNLPQYVDGVYEAGQVFETNILGQILGIGGTNTVSLIATQNGWSF